MAEVMPDTMITQLRDIHGLDAVSWWPLAPGWWLLILGAMVLLLTITLLTRRLIKYPPGSWRGEARKALVRLRRNARTMPDKKVAAELSEILRRIAIARHGRKQIANLNGNDWLNWLANSDPNGFDWRSEADILLVLPYAPPPAENHQQKLQRLIKAALQLVAHSHRKQIIAGQPEPQDV
jgi:hypothetical protein